MLHRPRRGDRRTEIAERLATLVQPPPAFLQPILEIDVVVAAVACLVVQFVGVIDRDHLLHVGEEFLEIDDIAVVLVVAIQAVGAADGLEQGMVVQLVVQVDAGAGGRIEAGQQLADDDQQLAVGRLLDKAALDLRLVLLRAGKARQHVPRVGVELVAFVAVGRLARDGVVVRLVGSDDAAVLAKRRILQQAKVVTGVMDGGGHEDGRAAAVVQARAQGKVLDDAAGDAQLALLGAHQLFQRGPVLAHYGLLEVVEIPGLLVKPAVDGCG